MSATSSPGAPLEPAGRFPSSSPYCFGHESSGAAGEWSVEWRLKRNCSLAPHQLLCFCFALCGLSLGVALFLWWYGVPMVMPFAWAEVLAVGVAVIAYARHATDGEWIALHRDRLTVECAWGFHLQRVEFRPQWVSMERQAGEGSLVLSFRARGEALRCDAACALN